jgi:hypothetical protein
MVNDNQIIQTINRQLLVQRLIAIWALSEAALGGLLHALKIPLTGIFINGSAVIIIALIAYFADKKGAILKATLIVLLVKAAVSPHTPLNAYLAVSLQGLIGEIIFSSKKYFKIKSVIFGVLTLFLSGIQRIIVVTILFGENLWDSIDLFGNYVLSLLPFIVDESANYDVSYWLIALYAGIHLLVGILIGIFAGKTPPQLLNIDNSSLLPLNQNESFNQMKPANKRKRKFWLKKPSGIAILFLVAMIIALTYIYPQFSETAALKAVIMVVRSILIMLIWYLIAGPFFLKLYKNYIKKHGSKYTKDVDYTLQVLPATKSIVVHSWKHSKKYRNIKRVKHFILTTIINMLVLDLPINEKNISVDGTQK